MAALMTEGWFSAAQRLPSPNRAARLPDERVSLVVIHNISLPPFAYGNGAIADLFLNRINPAAHPFFSVVADLRVSSHFVIARDGGLQQFVSCDEMAYHAGVSVFGARARCNEFSIGIELEGCDFEPFTEPQYQQLLCLLPVLRQHYPVEAVCGHQDIAPQRKTDPGHFFDWDRLRAAGEPVFRL